MTKQQEIKALAKFIYDLGSDSYLGPWLADCQAEIERDITNDHEPTAVLPGTARRIAAQILADARDAAGEIQLKAQTQATEVVQRARTQADEQRRYVADAIAKHAAEAIARIGGRY